MRVTLDPERDVKEQMEDWARRLPQNTTVEMSHADVVRVREACPGISKWEELPPVIKGWTVSATPMSTLKIVEVD